MTQQKSANRHLSAETLFGIGALGLAMMTFAWFPLGTFDIPLDGIEIVVILASFGLIAYAEAALALLWRGWRRPSEPAQRRWIIFWVLVGLVPVVMILQAIHFGPYTGHPEPDDEIAATMLGGWLVLRCWKPCVQALKRTIIRR